MITEISLQNTASYKTKTTLYTDKKINIIYGLNGTGKSTFSNYLHKQDDIKYNSCSNSNTSDSKIIVYNQSFIQENFYSKDTLNGIFSLSKENKDAIEKVTQITLELETLDKVLVGIKKEIAEELKKSTTLKEYSQNKTWEIKANHAGGDRVLEFCLQGTMGSRATLFDYLNSIPLPNTEPAKTIIELKEEANAISGDDVTKYFPLKKFKPTNLNDSEKDLLSEIIIGSESSPVSSLILKLKNSDWVHDGLKFLDNSDGEKCPFCQSETITKQLTHDIRNYFDESYKSNIEKIKLIRYKYRSDCTNNPNIDYYKENSFTKKYILDINEQYTRLKIAEDDNLNLISEKISNPSLSIVPVDTISTIKALNSIIDIINNDITTYNNKIDNSEAELRIIKSDFWKIMRLKYDQTISNYNDSLKTINATIESKNNLYSDNERLRSKKNLDRESHQRATVNIDDAVLSINQGLLDIGISGFHIEKHEENLYRLVRDDINSKIFSSLSEGEKTIISFLYFREIFKGKSTATENNKSKIAVIDDPVSSLSHIYVYNIGQLIKNDFFKSKSIEQVFILTHSLYFFYELTDTNHDRRRETQNLFRITKNNIESKISIMEYEEIQNDYQSYWSVINDENQPSALIANCMRNIIEYFFSFVQKSDLSNVIQKPELQDHRFHAFIRYINRESHSLGQNIFDFKEFDYTEFKEGLRLLFLHAGYEEHYKTMSKIKKP